MAPGGDAGTWLIIRLQGAPALPEPLPERHKRTGPAPPRHPAPSCMCGGA